MAHLLRLPSTESNLLPLMSYTGKNEVPGIFLPVEIPIRANSLVTNSRWPDTRRTRGHISLYINETKPRVCNIRLPKPYQGARWKAYSIFTVGQASSTTEQQEVLDYITTTVWSKITWIFGISKAYPRKAEKAGYIGQWTQ